MLSGLTNPDGRRALRSIVDALVMLALVVLLYLLIGRLKPEDLPGVARGALIILGMGTLFYGSENITRAFKLTGPLGTTAEFAEEKVAAAADKVAGAASDAAEEVKAS